MCSLYLLLIINNKSMSKIKITENHLKKIIEESIKYLMTENHMQELYHYTDTIGLVNIIKSNALYLNDSNAPGRNGKYYLSLTRHKNNKEGFKVNNSDKYTTGEVRLTFDVSKLSNIKGVTIKPYEYYNHTSEEWDNLENTSQHGHSGHMSHNNAFDGNKQSIALPDHNHNAKWMYRNMKKYNVTPFSNKIPEDEPYKNIIKFGDDTEFYNQAEEVLASNTLKQIDNPFNYITRIDILLRENVMDNNEYGNENTFAYHICKYCLRTPALNEKTFFYLNENEWEMQRGNTLTSLELYKKIQNFKNINKLNDNERNLNNRKPISRNYHFNNDPENEEWSYNGYDEFDGYDD